MIGGSSARCVRSHTRSSTLPAVRATATGTRTRGGSSPAADRDPVQQLAHRARLPVRDHERATAQLAGAVPGGDDRVGRVVDVGGVDERRAGADHRQATLPGAGDDAADELLVAGAPHQMRTHRDDREVVGVGGQRQQLSATPCSASSCRARDRDRPDRRARRRATCPNARRTATRRTRIARRRPIEPRRARSRFPRCWSPRTPATGPRP